MSVLVVVVKKEVKHFSLLLAAVRVRIWFSSSSGRNDCANAVPQFPYTCESLLACLSLFFTYFFFRSLHSSRVVGGDVFSFFVVAVARLVAFALFASLLLRCDGVSAAEVQSRRGEWRRQSWKWIEHASGPKASLSSCRSPQTQLFIANQKRRRGSCIRARLLEKKRNRQIPPSLCGYFEVCRRRGVALDWRYLPSTRWVGGCTYFTFQLRERI